MKKSKKHIVLYSLHYHPEMIGIGVYNHEMARYLVKKGYRITVVTAFPWYPYWKVMDGYSGKLSQTESVDGITIKRSFVPSPNKINAKSRILHECVFAATSILNLAPLFFKKVDAVFTVCPPLQLGLISYVFCKLKRSSFIFHVQDLQVDAAFDMGLLKNKTLLWVLKGIEKFIFKKADVLTTISDGMKKRIISKGIDESRVSLFPNWIDTENITQMERNNIFRKTNLIPEDVFLVLYAGNIGEKQGVDIILDVAGMTKAESRIQYVIVGGGANREKLEAMADERKLTNVKLLHLQPKEMLSPMLAAADLSLIIQKKSVGDIVMPSKLLNIMASARPVVATADPGCELTSFIKKVECGITVVPEDPKLLKDAILRIYGDAEAARRYGLRARAYAEEHLSIENVLGSFDRSLRTLLNKNSEGFVQTTA